MFLLFFLFVCVKGLELPGSCKPGQYYEPGFMECKDCPANVSMVTAPDGFGCTCEDHSIPSGIDRCRPCNITAVVSSDGRTCVSRKCQNSSGRIVCRKCPANYISVTQNFDGSPMKEVLCVKCARGFKAENNMCVRCESCVCARNEIVIRGRCVPKRYLNERPKYEETRLHPLVLLDTVKHEFLCTQNDVRACRTLASECVRNLYTTDLAGPCRLWIQPKITQPKSLPHLTIESTASDKNPGEITFIRGMTSLNIALAVYTVDGGFKILQDPNQKTLPCQLPLKITVGKDFSNDCHMNISKLDSSYFNETFSPFLNLNGDLKPLPVSIRKPDGNNVPKGTWSTTKFRRYFLIHNSLSITTLTNISSTVYLQTLIIRSQIQRDKYKSSSLRFRISIEAQYATKSSLSETFTTTLKVENEMPSAGITRGLEIWGGVLGALLSLYAIAQWRGVIRRGGHYISLFPVLAGSVSDALYFATLFSTLHALAAEAGTLGMTLPLSKSEEHMNKSFVYSTVLLKALKLAWINWNQCRCDIFFIDWAEYNPSVKETAMVDKSHYWKVSTLAREWSLMQTKRRASPGLTVTLTLIILHVITPWQLYLPQSRGYKWAVASLTWWSAYIIVLSSRWILDRILDPPTATLPKVCTGTGLSLLVFQEEYYAHYVHGRNDEADARSMSGPLATCRVVCAPQLRMVYKQLSTPGLVGLGDTDTKQVLLSRFLAAFFERALDGLSWVASERTMPERLLDVELTSRENGNTSALLYDPDISTPSCFILTWWSQEWSLGTFDAMLFGCIFIATEDSLLAALITIIVWQIMKHTRSWFGDRNQKEKIEIY